MKNKVIAMLLVIFLASSMISCSGEKEIRNTSDIFRKYESAKIDITATENSAVEFVKGYFEDWFKYRNTSKDSTGEALKYPEFKTVNDSGVGFIYNCAEFREKYAWSGEQESALTYGSDIMESIKPSTTLSTVDSFDNVRVIYKNEDVYYVGVILTFKGGTKDIEGNTVSTGTYYGIVEVLKEEIKTIESGTETAEKVWKVKKVHTFAPLNNSTNEKSSKFIDTFKELMYNNGVEIFENTFKEVVKVLELDKSNKLFTEVGGNDTSYKDVYRNNKYKLEIANRVNNYKDIEKLFDLESVPNKDIIPMAKELGGIFEDLVEFEVLNSYDIKIEDIFDILNIKRKYYTNLDNSIYKETQTYEVELTENEILMGIKKPELTEEAREEISEFGFSVVPKGVNKYEQPEAIVRSNIGSGLMISEDVLVTSLSSILGVNNFNDIVYISGSGKEITPKGVITYNKSMNLVILRTEKSDIEVAKNCTDHINVYTQKDDGIYFGEILEDSNGVITGYVPSLSVGDVVMNEKNEVVCIVLDDSNTTSQYFRGVGTDVLNKYLELINTNSEHINVISIEELKGVIG